MKVGRAGASTVNITPSRKVQGYGGQAMRRGPEDSDLLAHAVVISDGQETAAVVSVDVVAISRGQVLAIQERCELRTGIPARNVFIGATHDHSAPHAAPMFVAGAAPDPLFLETLADQLVETVQTAHENLRPAVIAAGQAPTHGVTFNRRLLKPDGTTLHVAGLQESPEAIDFDPNLPPAGPVDEDVGYIMFEEHDGTPIACLMSFSCHDHASGAGYFHRDMFGRAGQAIQDRLGHQIPTPFLAGACGDTMWVDPKAGMSESNDPTKYWVDKKNARDKQSWSDQAALCWELGYKIADAVLQNVKQKTRKEISGIRTAVKLLEIPDRTAIESEYCDDLCRGYNDWATQFAENRNAPEKKAVGDRGETTCVVEVGALAISDHVVVSTNPAEYFVAYGLEIKNRSPFEVTIISELTNGYCGYVPTEEAFPQKGYETHRTVFQSRLIKSGGRIIAEACINVLDQCKGKS